MDILDIFKTKKRQKAEKTEPEPEKQTAKEPEKPANSYTFTDEDRDRALAAREAAAIRKDELRAIRDEMQELRAQAEMKRLKQQLEDMRARANSDLYDEDEDEDEEDDEEEDPFNNMLKLAAVGIMQGMNSNKTPPPQTYNTPAQQPTQASIEITDADINDFIENNKEIALKAQKMPDNLILKTLQNKFSLDAVTAKRALEILKKKEIKVTHGK